MSLITTEWAINVLGAYSCADGTSGARLTAARRKRHVAERETQVVQINGDGRLP